MKLFTQRGAVTGNGMIIGQGVIVKDMGTRHMRVVGATIG